MKLLDSFTVILCGCDDQLKNVEKNSRYISILGQVADFKALPYPPYPNIKLPVVGIVLIFCDSCSFFTFSA